VRSGANCENVATAAVLLRDPPAAHDVCAANTKTCGLLITRFYFILQIKTISQYFVQAETLDSGLTI
jgi:hypothetical protein